MTDTDSSKTKNKGAIVIDLFAPNVPGSTTDTDLIQKSLRDQLVTNIRNSVRSGSESRSSDVVKFVDESGRNVFFVDGTRGAGKTTFINSVVERLNKDKEDSGTKIKCLPTIDPTKLPRHEPILVTVTARLNVLVSKNLNENWASDNHKKKKEQWQNQLEKLKRGLHLLTAKEYKPEYFSDALKLDTQLDYSIGGQDLPEIFDTLVNCACDILSCNAILISFDDIDTQFDTGWDVLESIRKFFNSRKLVVVATGDLRLYSQLIRGKQYENYSKTLLDQEKESARLAERGYMVEHLEQQYLLKLFPVQKRIQLKTMLQLVGEKGHERDCENIRVIYKITEAGAVDDGIRSVLEDVVSNGLNVRAGSDLDIYVDELLKQPVRLLMQVMQDYCLKNRVSVVSKSVLLRDSLYGAMLSSIYRAGLNYEQHRIGMDSFCDDVFKYSRQDQEVNTGFYLRPQSGVEALRNCSIYLSSQVGALCGGSLSKILQHMLVGCGSVTLFDMVEKRVKVQDTLESDFKSYMSIGRRESVTNWANRSCAVISDDGSPSNSPGVHLGMIQVNKRGQDSKGIYRPLDINNESGVAKISLAACMSSALVPTPADFLSVFNLIGAVADLAEAEPEKDRFNKELIKILARPTCLAPTWSKYVDNGIGAEVEDHALVSEDDIESSIDLLIDWNNLVRRSRFRLNPSSILIGKIWTRLYFNLSNISDSHSSKLGSVDDAHLGMLSSKTNAAKIMRFNVLAFLHAVLVEEDLYHRVDQNSQSHIVVKFKQNPVTAVAQLEEKIRSIGDDGLARIGETHPIFYLILKCPLIWPFLFPFGAVNVTDPRLRKQEKSLFEKFEVVLGQGFFKKSFDEIANAEVPVEGGVGFKSLNVVRIAGVKYDK